MGVMHHLEMMITMLGGVIVFSLLFRSVISDKVCTNSGVLSNTNRFELLSLNNSWEKENIAHLHLVHSDDETWSRLIPRKILKEDDGFSWNIMYHEMKNSGGERGFGVHFLKDVPLHDVRLDSDSDYGLAQQTNLEYLLMLDVDSLVWSFRKTAGLETLGEAYGGWEAPDVELRGHFVGHYMSASAQMWASTHNATLKEKMSLVVSALSECQTEMATGYLSAFPSELFDRFEALESVWAPYYTIHKILAGLLDQYTFAGNDQALRMTSWMVEYFYNRVQNVISKYTIERHWLSLNEETGGMNDVLYRLHTITGDKKHLYLAHLFDKPCFLGLLAMKADDISGFHSNTHIPIVIGSQLRYEITGEPLYKEIGSFFMDIVNSSHSYATGGTSVGEFWSDPKRLASTLETENEESCTTYNMLKVSRNLFRWTKEMAYADYFERALINGVLGIQRGREPGVMIYMLPLHPGGSKARSYHKWGTKFNSFWCCYGTGIESFSKLGDSIYFEDVRNQGLYIIQYVPSSFNWKSGKILLRQTVEPVNSWNNIVKVVITISQNKKAERTSTLNLRIPTWTHSDGSKASCNDQDLSLPAPGNFLSITKTWSSGDKIILDLPLSLRTEAIKDDRPEYASLRAFLYGPYVLAGFSNGDHDMNLEENSTSISDSITPVPSHYNNELVTIKLESNNSEFVLANNNGHINLLKYPSSGTNAAVAATFRLVELSDLGIEVMLEPFDYPGMFLMHHGEGESLGLSEVLSTCGKESSIFRMVNGVNGMFSLESDNQRGCYVYTELADGNVKLNCSSGSSFVFGDGIKKYHPISFLAKGVTRNFVLSPLNSMLDESYAVYFNTTL